MNKSFYFSLLSICVFGQVAAMEWPNDKELIIRSNEEQMPIPIFKPTLTESIMEKVDKEVKESMQRREIKQRRANNLTSGAPLASNTKESIIIKKVPVDLNDLVIDTYQNGVQYDQAIAKEEIRDMIERVRACKNAAIFNSQMHGVNPLAAIKLAREYSPSDLVYLDVLTNDEEIIREAKKYVNGPLPVKDSPVQLAAIQRRTQRFKSAEHAFRDNGIEIKKEQVQFLMERTDKNTQLEFDYYSDFIAKRAIEAKNLSINNEFIATCLDEFNKKTPGVITINKNTLALGVAGTLALAGITSKYGYTTINSMFLENENLKENLMKIAHDAAEAAARYGAQQASSNAQHAIQLVKVAADANNDGFVTGAVVGSGAVAAVVVGTVCSIQ